MKKVLFTLAALILVSVLAVSFAQQSGEAEGMLSKMGKDVPTAYQGMMGKEHMMSMCPMHHMMMGSMMSKTIVPTEDNGVIVLAGEKLMKFDKDLNLVKEAQVPIDTEAIQSKMTQMMGKCPMCKGMMQGVMMKSGSSK